MKIPDKVLKLCEYLQDKKAENVVVADTTKMLNVANYNIISTATSTAHTKALADYLEEQTSKNNDYVLVNREGFNFSEWIILDFDEIFVHIFTKEKREYYNIEKLFNEGNNVKTIDKIQKELKRQEKVLKEKQKLQSKKDEFKNKLAVQKQKREQKKVAEKAKKEVKTVKTKKEKPVKVKKEKSLKSKDKK